VIARNSDHDELRVMQRNAKKTFFNDGAAHPNVLVRFASEQAEQDLPLIWCKAIDHRRYRWPLQVRRGEQ
jgi:hypothetical protein